MLRFCSFHFLLYAFLRLLRTFLCKIVLAYLLAYLAWLAYFFAVMHHLKTLRLQCMWKDLALFVLRTAYRYFFGLETGAKEKKLEKTRSPV